MSAQDFNDAAKKARMERDKGSFDMKMSPRVDESTRLADEGETDDLRGGLKQKQARSTENMPTISGVDSPLNRKSSSNT